MFLSGRRRWNVLEMRVADFFPVPERSVGIPAMHGDFYRAQWSHFTANQKSASKKTHSVRE